ncbi:flagellar hook-associated protein FlgL [Paenibacillus sp. N4]|uniref:flagellar hook-associated protein FlgL n=1 Tax=Paenibacillus vietnamensis TaxID=2590547 RepID=UPI001CD1339B|nr:flagellar hook-associated protein FlgL [Paenibacillus vietnamensis]MCA0757552.1 flagellar hook-associated protein FlgL [Paenibacillus vietnamensis]
MSLRVTQSMLNTQLMRNLTNNLGRMNTLQNQLSTGKIINKPSDDPIGITFALRYRSELSSTTQYTENVNSAISFLQYTDTTIGQAGDIMQRARELLVKGANGTLDQTDMNAIKIEMSQLYNQMIEIGNTRFNGQQVFNGENTTEKPYSTLTLEDTADPLATPPIYKAYHLSTDTGSVKYELSANMSMAVNVTGNEVFGEAVANDTDTTSDNVFQLLRRAHDMLATGDHDGISALIGQFDTRMNKMLTMRSEVGARMNRVELIQNRLSDLDINLQTLQSKTEDADMAKVITNMKMEENVYQASLSVGSQLIRPSLVDFLR